MGKRNYLTRLADTDQRARPRRQCRVEGKVYYLRRGVRGYASQSAVVINISESGCLIRLNMASQIPGHIYLVMEGIKAKFPCAVVNRTDDRLHVSFQKEVPTPMVEQLVVWSSGPRIKSQTS